MENIAGQQSPDIISRKTKSPPSSFSNHSTSHATPTFSAFWHSANFLQQTPWVFCYLHIANKDAYVPKECIL